jgi:hypothetical protein
VTAVTASLAAEANTASVMEAGMYKDERDLLDVLKFELEFLEKGGYGRSPREPWRPRYIFEDSPSCMNYDCKDNPQPCGQCVLTQLVPPDLRSEKTPCRQIPLNALGENLDSMYRYDDQREIEAKVENWLRTTIAKLEAARPVAQSDDHVPPAPSDEAMKCTPLFQQLHPKCANPACFEAFHWLGGGKFFRFQDTPTQENSDAVAVKRANNIHRVKHFWLCERCAHIFTMVYQEESGVVLKLLWPELPVFAAQKELPATFQN